VAAVAALGLGVRGFRALTPERAPVADREALAQQIARVDSAVVSGGRRPRRAAEPAPSERHAAGHLAPVTAESAPIVDIDRATIEELDQLPGIGPALAARIVADRELNGPFGSLSALEEVRGIGPSLAAKLATRVTFSGPPRPPLAQRAGRDRQTP
jgi:competence ComEA-like helix-hairpin-helix protein